MSTNSYMSDLALNQNLNVGFTSAVYDLKKSDAFSVEITWNDGYDGYKNDGYTIDGYMYLQACNCSPSIIGTGIVAGQFLQTNLIPSTNWVNIPTYVSEINSNTGADLWNVPTANYRFIRLAWVPKETYSSYLYSGVCIITINVKNDI